MFHDCQTRLADAQRRCPRGAFREEAQALFQIGNLKESYRGKTALDGADLKLAPKRVTALIGPSGCGKTSLLQCLNRLTDMIPRCTVEGTLMLDGMGLSSGRMIETGPVGRVFEKPRDPDTEAYVRGLRG